MTEEALVATKQKADERVVETDERIGIEVHDNRTATFTLGKESVVVDQSGAFRLRKRLDKVIQETS